ncbi:hypothetical protein VSU19_22985 [Verrucomicrobiales bacterium BCK34]|nr:hypothetical protein [Verrucomicrobiales bacterium BCK34]
MNGVYTGRVGATAVALCLMAGSCSKAPPREYEVLNAPAPDSPAEMELNATLIVEVIEVKSSLFDEWIAGNRLISDSATPLRKSAQTWIHRGDAAIAETLTLSVRDGSSSRIQSEHIAFSMENEYRLKTNTLGSSVEASVTITPDSRMCSVQLHPTFLHPDKTRSDSTPHENIWNWSGTNLASSMELPEMTYGFLGSRKPSATASKGKDSEAMTSLFFLRADTNLPPLPETPSTSQL